MNGHGHAASCLAATVVALGCLPAQALPRCEGRLPDALVESMQAQTLDLLRDRQFDPLQARFDERLAAHAAGRRTDEEVQLDFAAFERAPPSLTPLIADWVTRHPASYAAHQAMAVHLGAVGVRSGSAETPKNAAAWARKALRLDRRPLWSQAWLIAHAPPTPDPPSWWQRLMPGGPPIEHPAPSLRRRFDEALAASPESVVLREAWLQQLAPTRGGTIAQVEAFAAATAVALPADRRDAVAYAARMTVADALAMQPALEPAIAQYQLAAGVCRRAEPWVAIASIRLGQKRFAEALLASDTAAAVSPGSMAALHARALALRGLGRHADAVALLDALAPHGDPAVNCLLADYLATGLGGTRRDPDDARRLLTQAARAGHGPAVDRLARLIADEVRQMPSDVATVQDPLNPERRRP